MPQAEQRDAFRFPPDWDLGALLELVLEASQEGIVFINRDGAIELYNDRFAALWGLPRFDENSGRVPTENFFRVIADQVPRSNALLRELRDPDSGTPQLRPIRLLLADGRVFEARSAPYRTAGGVVGRIWAFRDVTATIEAEQALQHSQHCLRVISAGRRWLRSPGTWISV
jgi:PAS domain S-box-containing protein